LQLKILRIDEDINNFVYKFLEVIIKLNIKY